MENTTRLLLRHDEHLRGRQVVIVEADDSALATLPAAGLTLCSDDCRLPGRQPDWLPRLPAQVELIIVIMPKSRERLRLVLGALAGQLSQPTPLWLVGPGQGGIRGGATDLATVAADVVLQDSARHCKLYSATLAPAPFSLTDHQQRWHYDGLVVTSYPGVFSHGRLDEGTALLLSWLAQQPLTGRALDIGCGAGILTAWLARAGLTVTAVDLSATAVAATQATLAANLLSARVSAGDLYQSVSGRFDLIVSNPPFHDGLERTTAVSERLIREAPRYLHPQGRLVLVANQGLPYEAWLRQTFRVVDVAAESRRFRVWVAHTF